MQLTSTAFAEGAVIPTRFTADGGNLSPPLAWSGAPGNTQSFALVCEDPDAPRGTWIHWVLYNLPADCTGLVEDASPKGGLPKGAKEGMNSWSKTGYGGPSPPPAKPHRYFFKLYALGARLDLPDKASRQQLEDAMKGNMLATAQLMGKYGR
ncbi:MAG: YbhB/YbcL family Raf kinase inhibitor-like protein [Gemmataceae bacterium]|nr:YbhB/YbcL family Raf kinase inhibitor-like protein [Gemmataceae bacterium]MCI0742256.1 YbhB/YbcL family Raf kinase inhibitor-like protein [Gemmataceae bacterium]